MHMLTMRRHIGTLAAIVVDAIFEAAQIQLLVITERSLGRRVEWIPELLEEIAHVSVIRHQEAMQQPRIP